MSSPLALLKNNYRSFFAVSVLLLIFYVSIRQSYLLFHTVIELFSIVMAFAVFIVSWNSRNMQDNKYLTFVGISYLFIGALDLMHTLTYKGMTVIPREGFLANQFWIATRMMEALTFLAGLFLMQSRKKLHPDLVFAGYFLLTILLICTIMVWQVFPVCFIAGAGQTAFKVYAEYGIIAILSLVAYLLMKRKRKFSVPVYRLLIASVIFTIISEFCFTLYVSNYSTANEIGHYAKLIAFFLVYKANVETGFNSPTDLIFKNLKESEEKYRTLAENLPGLILRFDDRLNCIYANSGFKKLMTAENTPVLVRSAKEQQAPVTLQDTLSQLIGRARHTGQLQESSIQLEQNARTRFYAVQVIPEYAARAAEGNYLVICQDVTELKQAEQQLKELNVTKDKLLSIIGHDLKNPFTSLLAFSELMYKNAGNLKQDKIEQISRRMHESSRQAYALLENLLNWSSIQTGMLKPAPQLIEVNTLFAEARRLAEPIAAAKAIELVFHPAAHQIIIADRQMVATVLRNLLSNAIKFSYANSRITIKTEVAGEDIVFSVADTGVGIAPENQAQLLKIDSHYSGTGTGAERGTGLGLVLCREFVELNGGKIWLESKPGQGTTFYFTQSGADHTLNMGPASE